MLKLAIVPSCNTFESHFAPLGVTPADLAAGHYRGTWITQYAERLLDAGIHATLVVPSRKPNKTVGALMDVLCVPVNRAYAQVPERLWRWRLRPVGSAWSTAGLTHHLQDFDLIYLQEYAYGRAGVIARSSELPPIVAAHHGASIREAPRFVRARLAKLTALSALTRSELFAIDEMRARNRLPPAAYLPNWVNDAFFASAEREGVPGRIVWSGRFDARIKGLKVLLAAFKLLPPHATLKLVGAGPDHQSLSKFVADDPVLKERVTFTGRVDSLERYVDEISEADVYVNASIIEGLPIAVLEAMAAGRRTVLTALDYVKSDLHGAPGMSVVRPGDERDLAAALSASLSAPHGDAQRDTISRWTERRFSASTAGAEVTEFLTRTAGRH